MKSIRAILTIYLRRGIWFSEGGIISCSITFIEVYIQQKFVEFVKFIDTIFRSAPKDKTV